MAPVLVLFFDRAYLFPSWREAFRERGSLYTGLLASWFVLASLNWSGPRAAVGGFSAGVEPLTYLLNQAVVIVDYLRLSVWPVNLVAFYGWPQPLTFAQVAVHLAFVATLVAATIVAVLGAPRAGFLGVWFFGILAPTSSIVPIATEVGAERRMYLPLVALIAMVVLALWRLAGSRVQTAVAVALAAVLAVTTAGRNQEYATGLSLAQTIVDRRPSAAAHHMLGEQLTNAGRLDEGQAQLQRAVDLGNTRARYQLGRVLMAKGDVAGAAQQFDAVVKLDGVPQTLRWLEPRAHRGAVVAPAAGTDPRREPPLARGRSAGPRGAGRGAQPHRRAGACWPLRWRGSSAGPSRSRNTGSTCRRDPATYRRASTLASRWSQPARLMRRWVNSARPSRPIRPTRPPSACWRLALDDQKKLAAGARKAGVE